MLFFPKLILNIILKLIKIKLNMTNVTSLPEIGKIRSTSHIFGIASNAHRFKCCISINFSVFPLLSNIHRYPSLFPKDRMINLFIALLLNYES